jgi:hypothetical protein
MKPSQAELILRIAENTYADGDETISEMRRLGAGHWQRVMEDRDLISKAREINEADQKRFAQYGPTQQQYRPELTQGQAVSRLAQPMKKAAE